MAVEEQGGSGNEAGIHGEGLPGIELDEDEAEPGGAIAFGFGLELAQEGLFEFEDLGDLHGGDEGVGSGDGGIGEQDVFKGVGAGGKDGGTLVDFGRIEQVEDGKMLDGKDFVHAFEAKATFAVEEIGDVGLFEAGLLGEAESGQFTCFDAVPKDFSKIILQDFELH